MNDLAGLHQRLATIQEEKSDSQADFARQLDESPQTVSNHLRGRTQSIPADFLYKVVDVFSDVDARWLLTGESKPTVPEDERTTALESQATMFREALDLPPGTDVGETVHVPIYEGKLGAGNGGGPSDRIVGFGHFLRRWLHQVLGLNPDRAFMAEVRGHSMKDLLLDRDLAVGETCEEIRGDGIYAFHWLGDLYVKHVHRAEPEELHLISENNSFDTKTVTADDADSFHLIGQVKGKLTRPDS